MIYWFGGGVLLGLISAAVGFFIGCISEGDRRYEMLAPLTKRVKSLEDGMPHGIFSEIALGISKSNVQILPVSALYDRNYPSVGVVKLKSDVATLLEKILENFDINTIQATKAELKIKVKK